MKPIQNEEVTANTVVAILFSSSVLDIWIFSTTSYKDTCLQANMCIHIYNYGMFMTVSFYWLFKLVMVCVSIGNLCLQPHSETAETPNPPKGPHIPGRSCFRFFLMMGLFAAKASPSSLSSSKLMNYQLKNEEEEDEKRKRSRVSQERQRTLDRLRTFKQVCALLFTGGVSVYVIIFCSPTPLSFSSGTQVRWFWSPLGYARLTAQEESEEAWKWVAWVRGRSARTLFVCRSRASRCV